MTRKKLKTAAAWAAMVLLALVVTVVTCDGIVRAKAKGRLYDCVADVPHRTVGLLLGTSPVTPWGARNNYYTYRMDAAQQLFEAGKIDYVLVSGDNRTRYYDEPSMMRDSLVARGVPTDRIVLDYAGLRTLDSVVRAKEIFGQDTITIISQPFHNERAIFLARHYGIEAIGYNARDVSRFDKWLKIHSRELLARVKLFLDLAVGKKPHFLGKQEKIGE